MRTMIMNPVWPLLSVFILYHCRGLVSGDSKVITASGEVFCIRCDESEEKYYVKEYPQVLLPSPTETTIHSETVETPPTNSTRTLSVVNCTTYKNSSECTRTVETNSTGHNKTLTITYSSSPSESGSISLQQNSLWGAVLVLATMFF